MSRTQNRKLRNEQELSFFDQMLHVIRQASITTIQACPIPLHEEDLILAGYKGLCRAMNSQISESAPEYRHQIHQAILEQVQSGYRFYS